MLARGCHIHIVTFVCVETLVMFVILQERSKDKEAIETLLNVQTLRITCQFAERILEAIENQLSSH